MYNVVSNLEDLAMNAPLLFLTLVPEILVYRYIYLQTESIGIPLTIFALSRLIQVIEKATARQRFFENSWMERPSPMACTIQAFIFAAAFGHWMESFFWGALLFIGQLVFIFSGRHRYV